MDWLERLVDAGFEPVGHWELVDDRPVCRLASYGSSGDVLYAFVVDGVVLYIGKTTMALSRRMYGYQNPGPSQRTNIANNANLVTELRAGRTVAIYALIVDGDLMYKGFRVSMAAGLEDDLIRQVAPRWNKSGT